MSNLEKKKQTSPDKFFLESFPEYDDIKLKLGNLTDIERQEVDLAFAFSVAFVQFFLNDTPNYELPNGTFGATRSNWTYHTAMAIAQTCKMLDLTCKFEAIGRRDAVIETRTNPPEILLVAEWEWDYNDIFGKGKELDKLKRSCKASKTAEAFLLVYCPASSYVDYLQRIAGDWISSMRSLKVPPTLFLHTIIFEEDAGSREFKRLRTVEINPTGIVVWNDQRFRDYKD